MLILCGSGSDVEGIYGPREFLAFYLTAAVVRQCGIRRLGLRFGGGHGHGRSGRRGGDGRYWCSSRALPESA